MSNIATYTFLPWLRQGIANQISNQVGSRASIPVEVLIQGELLDGGTDSIPAIQKDVQVYGPGDIIGIDKRAIVSVEPKNWITNFEPNYLPYIEFYDEDFPWRYSPMPNPTNSRLMPWLALIILEEDEFINANNVKDKPLPFIILKDTAKLQDAEQLWAWSHVHINENIIGSEFKYVNKKKIAEELEAVLNKNPDLAYSRIICPRKLEPKKAYHAFLVPAFESGRQACLGNTPDGINYDAKAWDNQRVASGTHQMPFYHRWYFRTGTVGDFEYLVRLLEPKPIDSRVGLRDMDVQNPGANISGIRDADLNGILKLGGALRVPDRFYTPQELDSVEKYRKWDRLNNTQPYPHNFQKDLASFINLTDGYQEKNALEVNNESNIDEVNSAVLDIDYGINNNPDPLITAPLYGRWHALAQRLLKQQDNTTDLIPNNNWVHELNLDPRWRVAAGFGTKVVQENQENYMEAAWKQIGDVVAANQRIREAQIAKVVSEVQYDFHLKPLKLNRPNKWLTVLSHLDKRIISNGLTVFHQKKESILTVASTSVVMRKIVRPRGKILRKRLGIPFNKQNVKKGFVLDSFTESSQNIDTIISRINEDDIVIAPKKTIPKGVQKPKDLSDVSKPFSLPEFLLNALEKNPWLKWLTLVIAFIICLILILLAPPVIVIVFGVIAVAGLAYLYYKLNFWTNMIKNANGILEENQTVDAVDKLPLSPDFKISEPHEEFEPARGNSDSSEAKRFKFALKDVNLTINESKDLSSVKKRPKLEINDINNDVFHHVNPNLTIPRWVFDSIKIPPLVQGRMKEEFVEAMAYPKFDIPMYKPLAEYSSELFLPNINFVEQNSISILETNQKFIESYMVGLNHEFARELFWREYLTDQRGSYFRQFWDTSGYLDTSVLSINSLKTRYQNILNLRASEELKIYLDNLKDPNFLKDEAFLREAQQVVLIEELKDIVPLHYWSKRSGLGDHDNREVPGEKGEEVVLVIRGELLKKYPRAVIYAHKAEWNFKKDEEGNLILDENGKEIIDLKQERTLALIPIGQENNPPSTIIKSPLYEAKVDPDIYFFGFDLSVCEAKGGTGKEDEPVDELCEDEVNWDDAGWFFVIKERPGEPRFGLDVGNGQVTNNSELNVWNDLSWDDVILQENSFLDILNTSPKTLSLPTGENIEKEEQHTEDLNITWNNNMNAADLAYVLYQVPVLVAVHACEMLPNNTNI